MQSSPIQTVCDLLVSKYAKNQLKTKFLIKMTKNALTKWYNSKRLMDNNRRLAPGEPWRSGTGCAGDEPLHTFRVPWGGLCCKRIRFLQFATILGWIAYYFSDILRIRCRKRELYHSSISSEITGAMQSVSDCMIFSGSVSLFSTDS